MFPQLKPILIKMRKGDEEIDANVFDKVAAILIINPDLLPWKFEQADFELKVYVRNKLKLDALQLRRSTDSDSEMYRL